MMMMMTAAAAVARTAAVVGRTAVVAAVVVVRSPIGLRRHAHLSPPKRHAQHLSVNGWEPCVSLHAHLSQTSRLAPHIALGGEPLVRCPVPLSPQQGLAHHLSAFGMELRPHVKLYSQISPPCRPAQQLSVHGREPCASTVGLL